MKKALLALLMLLLCVSLLVSCIPQLGGGSNNGGDDSTDDGTTDDGKTDDGTTPGDGTTPDDGKTPEDEDDFPVSDPIDTPLVDIPLG